MSGDERRDGRSEMRDTGCGMRDARCCILRVEIGQGTLTCQQPSLREDRGGSQIQVGTGGGMVLKRDRRFALGLKLAKNGRLVQGCQFSMGPSLSQGIN